MVSGCFSVSCSSASPPAPRMKSRTHSAATRTSPACSGSALTLGMRRSSESSSSQSAGSSATAWESIRRRSEPWLGQRLAAEAVLGDVFELLAVGERAQLLQALVLDLPDPLARDTEGAADLVERARLFPVEPVAHLE